MAAGDWLTLSGTPVGQPIMAGEPVTCRLMTPLYLSLTDPD